MSSINFLEPLHQGVTSRPGLRTLLAKDGVIYKEAMAIVAEDVKKIMAEEFLLYQVYMKANEQECIIEKEKESPPWSPPAKRAKFGTKAMPIDPLAEFIDLCVEATYAHEGFLCGTAYVCVHRHVCL